MSQRLIHFSTGRPRVVALALAGLAVLIALLAILPSVRPDVFPGLNGVRVDTDPENMLPVDEPIRVYHNAMQEAFDLNEIVVVGVVNEVHPDGVFNVASLAHIHDLTTFAQGLHWEDAAAPRGVSGVIAPDVLSPSTVDSIESGGLGAVQFSWLMAEPPETEEAAREIRRKALRLPFLNGTLVSEDGRAVAIYLPVTAKDVSHRVASALEARIATYEGDDAFHITGLPVANDTFGVQMFVQMAISAPLAMLAIFLLMLAFFRKVVLIVSPLLVALASVILTMGLLVISGNTVHIMSSMIPIFIMPIAVLDSVHILSEFFDRYGRTGDRRGTIEAVMRELFAPMFFTSLTSMAGFASLALTPNPPVQVFGIFVALGVFFAWSITIVFIPAYIMLIPEARLKGLGASHDAEQGGLTRALRRLGRVTALRPRLVLVGVLVVASVAALGIPKIQINDNPVLWFSRTHPIRVADEVLNRHFGGTYMAYLSLAPSGDGAASVDLLGAYDAWQRDHADLGEVRAAARQLLASATTPAAAVAAVTEQLDDAPDATYEAWDSVLSFAEAKRAEADTFKRPDVLRHLEGLQAHLLSDAAVGKVNSLGDVVRTVHRELYDGAEEAYRIPDTVAAVGQCLITYQGSHRPQDLWHFVTQDYQRTLMWVQLRSGNNRDMGDLAKRVDQYMATHPGPVDIEHRWFGLTYINVVWQQKMVSGMLRAFTGSFLVVLLMMIVLFRSVLWGLLSMIPLTLTLLFMYGMVGWVGKDYDMPIAVLSALTLGLAVDFAIHFLARSRRLAAEEGWTHAARHMFDEPARAITRNVIVIAIGFTPLLFAPLVPYRTVGVFMATILLVAGASTLLVLPSLLSLLERSAFAEPSRPFLARASTRVALALVATGTVLVNPELGRIAAAVAFGVVYALIWLLARLVPHSESRSGEAS